MTWWVGGWLYCDVLWRKVLVPNSLWFPLMVCCFGNPLFIWSIIPILSTYHESCTVWSMCCATTIMWNATRCFVHMVVAVLNVWWIFLNSLLSHGIVCVRWESKNWWDHWIGYSMQDLGFAIMEISVFSKFLKFWICIFGSIKVDCLPYIFSQFLSIHSNSWNITPTLWKWVICYLLL